MAEPQVREIGTVTNDMGEVISVGVDCDTVGIFIGAWLSADGVTLSQDQAEEFGRLFVAACWRAGENRQRQGAALEKRHFEVATGWDGHDG